MTRSGAIWPATDTRWFRLPALHRIQDDMGGVTLELYNLETDSLEQNNLTETEPEKVHTMMGELVEPGDLAYWPVGSAFYIFFGSTRKCRQ